MRILQSRKEKQKNCFEDSSPLVCLTLRAVVSLPALQTDAVPLLVAGVVAQRVIPWSAVVGAPVPKVVLVAEDVVGVTQLTLLPEVHVLGPVLPNGEPPLGRQTTDQVVLVVWRGEGGARQSSSCKLSISDGFEGMEEGEKDTCVFSGRLCVPGFDD